MTLKKFRAYQLAIRFYRLCEEVKCARHLREQLSRASSSVALNLGEGAGRPTRKDRRRFYYIALGSLRESQTILDLANLPPGAEVILVGDELGAHLYRLVQAMRPVSDKQGDDDEAWP